MSKEIKKNLAHSIFQLLYNQAKAQKVDFNLLLSRYGMERFLYRLSVSRYCDVFILKGASLFLAWKGQNYRVTRDIDLLGLETPDKQELIKAFHHICGIDCKKDGITFDPDSLKVEEIREGQKYDGFRVTLTGFLQKAKIPLQVDIGFGDIITPDPEQIEYPTLLDGTKLMIKAYPRYSMLAEKLEAIIHLGLANSRMKDFYDICLLSTLFSYDGKILHKAVKNTLHRRGTIPPIDLPYAFTSAFYEDAQKQLQWKAFIEKTNPEFKITDLASAVSIITRFLSPILISLQKNTSFDLVWCPEEGWV